MDKIPETHHPLRIVLEHTSGVLKGIHQIQGMSNAEGIPDPLPTFVEVIERPLCGDIIAASMVRQSRGAIYYRELTTPEGLGRFDRRQQ